MRKIDLTGRVYDQLTVIRELEERYHSPGSAPAGIAWWEVRCTCGKVFKLRGNARQFRKEEARCYGACVECSKARRQLATRCAKVGKTFGLLTVTGVNDDLTLECVCACGATMVKRTNAELSYVSDTFKPHCSRVCSLLLSNQRPSAGSSTPGPCADPERDAWVLREWEGGRRQIDIAKELGLTRERVRQVIAKRNTTYAPKQVKYCQGCGCELVAREGKSKRPSKWCVTCVANKYKVLKRLAVQDIAS